MDILFIEELRLDTEIGVYEWEKNIKQPISLNIEMQVDTLKAAKEDDLDYAVDYEAVSDRVTEFIHSQHFDLVETVANRAADIILKEFNVCWLRIKLSKLSAIKTAKAVGVIIERGEKK